MNILHLYPKLMNLYGEYGNIKVLEKHLKDQNIETHIYEYEVGDNIDLSKFDFIYCGSGLESNLMVALKDLRRIEDQLKCAINNGTLCLFTGNSMELLGKKIDDEKGLGIVNIETSSSLKRYAGDVITRNDIFGEVVGFINKCTIINNHENGLFDFVFKDKALNDNKTKEGYHINNLFGTHIIGPVLVKNPKMIKYFVETLGKKEDNNFVYKDIDYSFENDSYNVTLKALKGRMK